MTGAKVGIQFILCSDYSYIDHSFAHFPTCVRNQATVGLVSRRLGGQDIFTRPFMTKEKHPGPIECYFAMDHDRVKIKIPELGREKNDFTQPVTRTKKDGIKGYG
ncbi:hypothetical protein [Virgibacillus kimchii]